MDNLIASTCSNPELTLEEALNAYAKLGYSKIEMFSARTKSALDIEGDTAAYAAAARRHGMRFASLHLPPIGEDVDATLARAVRGARFAEAIGAGVVLFKAETRPLYVRAAKRFLDSIEGVKVVPVLQNHKGTAISSLEDYREVIEGIADARMKALLEVGHFHSVGVSWRQGCGLLGDRIALIHIKDQVGPQSVPFGTGEIDLPGLFRHMRAAGYAGDYVVEMEVRDKENTLKYLGEARRYIEEKCNV